MRGILGGSRAFSLFLVFSAVFFAFGTLGREELGAEIFLDAWGVQLDIAAENDGDIHLTYRRGNTIYYLRQINGSWEDERAVPGSDETTYYTRWYPHIAVDSSGNAHFAWAGPSNLAVYYNAFIMDNWSGLTTVISDEGGLSYENRCDIAIDINNNVFIVSQNDFSIKYNRKPFGGTWQTANTIFASYPSTPEYPSLAASSVDTSVHCTFAHNITFPSKGIQYHKWSAGSWGAAIRPWDSGGPCCANNTATVVDKYGKPHITWIRFSSEQDASHLYYVSQLSTGTWTNIDTLIATPQYFNSQLQNFNSECVLPRIAVANNNDVMIVYADGYPNTSKVFYRIRYHETGQWSHSMRITMASEYQNYPALAVHDNTFTVIWSDIRSNGMGIFSRKITTGNLPDPLQPPTLESAYLNNNKVYLDWTAPPNPYMILNHYILERKLDLGPWFQLCTVKQTSYIDEDFWLGTHFKYRVIAVDQYMRPSEPSNALDVYAEVPTQSAISIIVLFIVLSAVLLRHRRKVQPVTQ